MSHGIEHDIARIARISSVPTILEVITQMTGMRFAAVARVTDTQWVALAVRDLVEFGLKPGGELVLKSTICDEIRQHHRPVVFGEASKHPIFATHHTPRQYGLESYISVPIFRRDGAFFGTLCAIDPLPADIEKDSVLKTFTLFAELISTQLDSEERLQRADTALADANVVAELREQFIAVLGHDLRNPLTSISAAAELLQFESISEKGKRMLRLMRGSVVRMAGLIDDVLDFARGRLGGGIGLARDDNETLEPVLTQVVAELRATHPDRRIETHFALSEPVYCDRVRIGQLASNLLGNALTHGAVDQPVRLEATTRDGVLSLSVTNGGAPIPEAAMRQLFQPYFRERVPGNPDGVGLGLGLYIVSEIAKAHDGTMAVSSTEQETRFTFEMPLRPVKGVTARAEKAVALSG